jgi:hypothetical protein
MANAPNQAPPLPVWLYVASDSSRILGTGLSIEEAYQDSQRRFPGASGYKTLLVLGHYPPPSPPNVANPLIAVRAAFEAHMATGVPTSPPPVVNPKAPAPQAAQPTPPPAAPLEPEVIAPEPKDAGPSNGARG